MKKIILIIAAVALLASPAMAVDWNFYGSARMATYYISRDFKDSTPSDLDGGSGLELGETKDDRFQHELQGNSRIGATVKAENLGGRFEFGLDSGNNNVTLRRIFGTWNFGAATLKVGKDYTPVSQFISGQVFDGDLGLLGTGTAYGSRQPQLALSFGGFEVALIENAGGLLRGQTTADVDKYLPKIEAKFGMSFDTWNFAVMGGYQTYKLEGTLGGSENVNSWTVGADAGVNFGPAYVKGAASYGTNVGNAGWHITKATNTSPWTGTDNEDVKTLMAAIAAGFKFTDQLTFEAGFGYRRDKSDLALEDEDKDYLGYIQAVIGLAPGVWLIPEIGYYDFDKNLLDVDEGKQLYVGAKWQIDF